MKAPKAPDPVQTATTQSGLNRDTAITNYMLNATNQVTPYGSLTYQQTGNQFHPSDFGQSYWQGPNGEVQQNAPTGGTAATPASYHKEPFTDPRTGITRYRTVQSGGTAGTAPEGWHQVKGYFDPQFTATTKLSSDQQKLLDLQEQLGQSLLGTGVTQAGRLNQLLKSPFKLPGEAVGPLDLSTDTLENHLMELGSKRLQPQLQQRHASLEQDLYNRGVRPGSAAYDRAITGDIEGQNDAWNQLMLTGRGQAVNEQLAKYQADITRHNLQNQDYLTGRETPINEILALAGGGQVSNPNFVNTPGSNLQPVDYTNLVNQQYQQKLQSYQNNMSGLFGLGGALLSAIPFSDRRLKTDVHKVGQLDNGLAVYAYRLGSGPIQIGVMADEVEGIRPAAVTVDEAGFKHVDYSMAVL